MRNEKNSERFESYVLLNKNLTSVYIHFFSVLLEFVKFQSQIDG